MLDAKRRRSRSNSISAVGLRISSLILIQSASHVTYGFRSLSLSSKTTFGGGKIRTLKTTTTVARISSSSTALLNNNVYGKGADIWPESQEDAVELSSSFPNGIIPYSVIIQTNLDDSIYQQQKQPQNQAQSSGRRRRRRTGSRNYIKRILRRAASKEELDNEGEIKSIDKTPIAIGLSLVIRGLVRPMDVALVACWTAYFIILNMTARSGRRDSTTAGGQVPIMPALPPQGHVPAILTNPMGSNFESSSSYRQWLNLGAVVGLIGPLSMIIYYIVKADMMDAARVVSRPLFLLCCQIVTEAISKKSLVSK